LKITRKSILVTLIVCLFVAFLWYDYRPPIDLSKPPPITQTNPLALPVVASIDFQVAGSTAELIFDIPEKEPPEGRNFPFLGLNLKIPTWMDSGAKMREIDPLYVGKKPLRVEIIPLSSDRKTAAGPAMKLRSIATEEEKILQPGIWFSPLNQTDGLLVEPWSPHTLDYQAKGMRRAIPYYHTTLIAVASPLPPGQYKAQLTVLAPIKLPEGMSVEFSIAYARTPK
jgi:hypothetical protein